VRRRIRRRERVGFMVEEFFDAEFRMRDAG